MADLIPDCGDTDSSAAASALEHDAYIHWTTVHFFNERPWWGDTQYEPKEQDHATVGHELRRRTRFLLFGSRHDEPPWFAMLNQTRALWGIARESILQGPGISGWRGNERIGIACPQVRIKADRLAH